MNKEIRKLLTITALIAFAEGLFYNFLELWLTNNNMSTTTISRVLSLCALITVSVIFLCSNVIKPNKIKKFAITLTIIRIITILSLFFLYQSGLNIIIRFLIFIDYSCSVELFASIYPMITYLKKEDKLYAKKNLIYEIFYYLASGISGFLVGKTLLNYNVTYNTYLIFSALSLIIVLIILINVKIPNQKEDYKNLLETVFQKVRKDKISILYLLYIFFNNISFYALTGMLLTILTKTLELTPNIGAYVKLALSLISVGLGTLILFKLTSKNNYLNISIKYIGRILAYLIPIIYLNKITILIGIVYTAITSSAYGHILDAPYINRFNKEEQLTFANLSEMLGYLSRSIGTYFCGLGIIKGLKFTFIIAFIFTTICTIFAFLANYYKERSDKHDRQ